MKEFLSNTKRLLINSTLILAAGIGVVLVVVPAMLWVIKSFIFNNRDNARDMMLGVSSWNLAIAAAIDKFGNCAYGRYMTSLLLIDKIHPFGNSSETISAVLGWAYAYNDLTPLGLKVRKLVNKFDRSTKDHCEYYRLSSIRASRRIVNEHLKLAA